MSEVRQAKINRLTWSCRRGMLELDVILDNLANRLKSMSDSDLNTAESLLNLSDNDLWEILVARTKKPQDSCENLVNQLLNKVVN